MKRILLSLLFPLMLIPAAKADHFIGSDFAWECLGNDTFKIILTFYQDCNGCHFGERPTGCTWELCGLPGLSIRSNCGTKYATFKQLYHEDITPVCDEQCTRCTKCDCSFQFGIRKHVLETIVYVGDHRKNGCCEYTISYQSCCRNTTITTGAASNGFYVDAQFNACQTPCDNSPVFTNAPIAILCLGRDFIYNQGATDSDIDPKTGGLADSLVYSFGSPMASASQKTPWSGSYDYDKPLYFLGFPKTSGQKFPRGFSLDTFTGDMMFRPMKQEITVMAIKVAQYRNGKKISETRRDIQIIVIKCPDNEPPVLSGINCSNPKPQNFQSDACAGEKLCFTVCTSDKDKDDTVTIGWNAGIPGATFTVINKGDKRESGRFCWTPNESQVSKFPYSFVVTAKDDACPVNSYTARSFQIVVKAPPKAVYDTLIYDCGNARFNVRRTGQIKVSQYLWTLNGNVKVRAGNDVDTVYTKFKYPGKKPFALTLLGKNGCNFIYQDTITIPEFVNVNINKDTTVCVGATLNFWASVADSSGKAQVTWSNGELKKRKTSIVVGNRDTFIIAYVQDDQCTNSDTCIIKVNRPPDFDLGPDKRICPNTNHIFKPTLNLSAGDKDSIATYYWYQKNQNNFLTKADSFIAKDSALYIVVAEDSLKCRSVDSVKLFVNPKRNWLPTDQIVCIGDSFTFIAKEVQKASKFFWYNSPTDTLVPIETGSVFNNISLVSRQFGVKWQEKIKGLTCSELDSVNLKVNPLPELKLSLPVELCENFGEFSLSQLGSPIGGTWFDTSATRDYIRQNKFYTDEAGADGSDAARHLVGYTFQDLSTKCIDTAYGYLVIKPLPEVELSEDTIFICNTELSRDLNQYVLKVPNRGVWSGSGVVLTGSKYSFDLSVVGTTPAEYVLTYTYTNATGNQPWCSNSVPLRVKVIEVPTVEAGKYDSLCVNASTINLDQASPTGKTGSWYYNGTSGTQWVANNGTFNPFEMGVGEHKLSYVYIVRGSICSDTASTFITVNPLPKPLITTNWEKIASENRICLAADPLVLTGNKQDVNSIFTKTTFSGRGVTGPVSNEFKFDPKTAGLGSHTLTYEVVNIFGCTDKVTELVKVDDNKEVEFTNDVVCLGDTIQLSATVRNTNLLDWTTNGEGTFINTSVEGAQYIPQGTDLSQVFEITAKTNNDQNICPEASFKSELEVHPLPEISFVQSDYLGCAPLTVSFENNTSISRGEVVSLDYRFGNGKTATTKPTGTTVSTTYGVIGSNDSYKGWVLALSDKGCKDSTKFEVQTLLTPKAAFTPKPGETTIINPNIYFENKSEYLITENNAYSWYFDDHTVADGGLSTEKNRLYYFSDTGHYAVKLIVTNAHILDDTTVYCRDSIVHLVIVNPEVLVYIPNIFTPDGDGPEKNNVFQPSVIDATEYSVKVFNRWGERMWESQDMEESWDGSFNGAPCIEGVYLYVVTVKNATGKEYEFTGTVTLLR